MAVISMRQMLEAGAHFGHQTRRWNPKMKRFIFGERNGIYIIDLQQTLGRVDAAYSFVRDLVADGGNVLFVGTKKQAQDPVKSYAEKCGMPYVNERWLGGMLTNFETISKRVSKMLELERMKASGEFDVMIKKEALLLDRELTKLQRNLGGLRSLKKPPDAIFVLDTLKEHIAVTEAQKLGIPVVAVVDTNVNPEVVSYPIPGNDDAIRANSLFARVIADAVAEGRYIAQKREPAPAPAVEKSPEEIAAFEAEQRAARDAAAQAQAGRDARLSAPKDQSAAASDAARTPASVPAETTGPAANTEQPVAAPVEAPADAPPVPAGADAATPPADAASDATAPSADAASDAATPPADAASDSNDQSSADAPVAPSADAPVAPSGDAAATATDETEVATAAQRETPAPAEDATDDQTPRETES